MKVAYLAAGAGGMICGSCVRDNRLAATLLSQGRDIVLIPLYTPLRTDEVNVSDAHIYYGGINVYLQQKSWLFRHTPRVVDRVLDAPGLLKRAMKLAGDTPPETLGALTLSILRGEEGKQAKELERLIEGLRAHQPSLVNLPNLMFAGVARKLKAELGVPLMCTLGGEDIFLDSLNDDDRREADRLIRERAKDIDGFIAVSQYYAGETTRRFKLPDKHMHVVPLGVNEDVVAEPAERGDDAFRIGFLSRICAEKGLHILAEAFHLLHAQGRPARLAIAGYLPPSEQHYYATIHEALTQHGLDRYIDAWGEVSLDGKRRFFASLDAFSVPTVYRESKGLPIIEALANGVPVVQPNHGAFPELVEATGGGLLFEPENAQALADRIVELMDDSALRGRLGAQGRATVRASFTDVAMADATWLLYEQYVRRAGAS